MYDAVLALDHLIRDRDKTRSVTIPAWQQVASDVPAPATAVAVVAGRPPVRGSPVRACAYPVDGNTRPTPHCSLAGLSVGSGLSNTTRMSEHSIHTHAPPMDITCN